MQELLCVVGTYTTYVEDMGYIYTDFWKQDNRSDFYSSWCIASVTLFTPLQFFTHKKGIIIYFFK